MILSCTPSCSLFIFTIAELYCYIAKLSSSWQVKLQLHLNWDSYIITVRKCTPYPPHFPPTRASILAMLYKHYWNWNWVYGPLGWFIYNLTLFPTEGGGWYGPTWSKKLFWMFLFCIHSIIAKLSSSWQVKLQLHLNWDSYIITVRKCTPYPPHFPPTRASILEGRGLIWPNLIKKIILNVFSPNPTPFPGPGELCSNDIYQN